LSGWISKQEKSGILNDFYSFKRVYSKRYILFESVLKKFELDKEEINYLEFGVESGNSFKWWLENSKNVNSRFYGFDTFEGLPEQWGVYEKGEMSSRIPTVEDNRAMFVKGLFQETLPDFLNSKKTNPSARNVIHLDADLFSSTLYSLTTIAPILKEGDILFFDEFNVPNHEFFAFRIFCESFYVKTKLLGAVNNYYQVALIITR
jgi:hypothetical protein